MRSTTVVPAVLLLAAGGLAGCGEDTDVTGAPGFDYSAERAAPERSVYEEAASEETPDPDSGLAELELDNGATVLIWIDPEDIRRVYQQHSDPADGSAWTEPDLIHEAGDGCLFINADTNGDVVAATLGCYEDDAWIQQAPDRGQAVVTDDLQTWDVEDRGEFFDVPDVADDGAVSWVGG